jgi:hypothetical protein
MDGDRLRSGRTGPLGLRDMLFDAHYPHVPFMQLYCPEDTGTKVLDMHAALIAAPFEERPFPTEDIFMAPDLMSSPRQMN